MFHKLNREQYSYGKNNVLACLKAGTVKTLYFQDGFKDDKIIEISRKMHIKTVILEKKEMSDILNVNHQGVIAIVNEFKYSSLDVLLLQAKDKKNVIFLLLDEISDPHNFGAIIRSAEAFGVFAIVIKKDRQVSVNSTVMKVASGAHNNIHIARVANLNVAIDKLKGHGFWVVGTTLEAKSKVTDLDYDFNVALIVGSEGKGIAKLTRDKCDFLVTIPMSGAVNSLNVSVATGIVLVLIREKQLYL